MTVIAVVISRCSFQSHRRLVCINRKQSEGSVVGTVIGFIGDQATSCWRGKLKVMSTNSIRLIRLVFWISVLAKVGVTNIIAWIIRILRVVMRSSSCRAICEATHCNLNYLWIWWVPMNSFEISLSKSDWKKFSVSEFPKEHYSLHDCDY